MPERFKLDENLPRDAEALLSEAGHHVDTVLAERLGGEPDPNVLQAAKTDDRILVTLDLDFANIRRYPPSDHPGIWVLRPPLQSIDSVVSLLRSALMLLESESAAHQLWIVESGRVRMHDQHLSNQSTTAKDFLYAANAGWRVDLLVELPCFRRE